MPLPALLPRDESSAAEAVASKVRRVRGMPALYIGHDSRRNAYCKMVSLVLGTKMVRKEIGFPEAECHAADERYSLVVPTK